MKKYTMEDKLKYYQKRAKDKSLPPGKREFAESFVKSAKNHLDLRQGLVKQGASKDDIRAEFAQSMRDRLLAEKKGRTSTPSESGSFQGAISAYNNTIYDRW